MYINTFTKPINIFQREPLKFDVNHCGAPEEIVHLVDNIKKVKSNFIIIKIF